MTRRLRQVIGAALLPSAAFVALLLTLQDRTALIVHLWAITVLAIAVAALIAGVRTDVPRPDLGFEAALTHRPVGTVKPPALARLERELSMGTETAFDTHARLRPLFRELAGSILLTHHGVDLARSPERARTLVGAELWSLVRPDAAIPEHRGDPGIHRDAVECAVSDLERLAWS